MKNSCTGKVFFLFLVLSVGFFGVRCAPTREGLHLHGELPGPKAHPKDYVHPLKEINLGKVVDENRGLKIYPENATKVHDYYRGGVQEKAEAEDLFQAGRWGEAERHLDRSIEFLLVVLRYLPEDETDRNIYGDHTVIFLPNLLMADNFLKLAALYHETDRDEKGAEAKGHARYYLGQSLKDVKTEWAFELQKRLDEAMPKR